jgi:5-(carboxyamino)imidazole ribonucleotide synthase
MSLPCGAAATAENVEKLRTSARLASDFLVTATWKDQ